VGTGGLAGPAVLPVFVAGEFVVAGEGAGTAVPPGAVEPLLVTPPEFFVAAGSCLGTLGSRCASMSAARIGDWSEAQEGSCAAVFVITSTSSNRCRSVAGFTLIIRKGSLSWSGVEVLTIPTAKPLG